jgi:dTMP kinase
VFVTFEGPEGAGKSSAIRGVAASLESQGKAVVVTREPGSGAVGAAIRALLLDGDHLDPTCELFLFLADRAQHVAEVIRPALAGGKVVLCDRHADSTVVYQGYGRGLDVEKLRELNAIATGGLVPDLTLLLDLHSEVGLKRIHEKDRLDAESIEFHHRVRQGFLEEAKLQPMRWVVLDASRGADDVARDALNAICERMNR